MFLLELVEIYFNACADFWTAESSAQAWQQWLQIVLWITLRVCLPLYMLTLGPKLFLTIKNKTVNKWLDKGFSATVVAHVALAVGPVLLPLAFIGALVFGVVNVSQHVYAFFRHGLLDSNNS